MEQEQQEEDRKRHGTEEQEDTPSPEKKSRLIHQQTYWDSPEARKISAPDLNNSELEDSTNNVLEVVQNWINMLVDSDGSPGAWRQLIAGEDTHDVMSEYDKWVVRQKATFISLALQTVTNKDPNSRIVWIECCSEAVQTLNSQGKTYTVSGLVVQKWHRMFARRNSFPNPHPVASGCKPLPRFFESNPFARREFEAYADANLHLLSAPFMTEYVNKNLVPRLVTKHNAHLAANVDQEEYLRLNDFIKSKTRGRSTISNA
jgi:hypothetical protein